MSDSRGGYLAPRYQQRAEKKNKIVYDCVDSADSRSDDGFTQWQTILNRMDAQPKQQSVSVDASSEDETILVREQLALLCEKFPAYRTHMRMAAYQAGIYESKHAAAFDPEIFRFIRTTDNDIHAQMPTAVKDFIAQMQLQNESSNKLKLNNP